MKPHESTDCIQTLLDLVCYEIQSGRLSPEMENLLEDHLVQCPSCREQVGQFGTVLYGASAYQNFG